MHDTTLKYQTAADIVVDPRPVDGTGIPIPAPSRQFSGGLAGIDLT
jgi:hypothetical protein